MFLPVCREDMEKRNWQYLHFLLIGGDAYVDHCTFGTALIGRYLESLGYRVGIIAQPDWKSDKDWLKMGRPAYGVFIAAGNMDSMLSHYTAAKKPRRQDLYSPGGKRGLRPDYASVVYTRKAREVFGENMPLILGGVEASLRRFVHYDYWQDKLLPSVIYEAGADLLIYGMAEHATKEVARILSHKGSARDCRHVSGLSYIAKDEKDLPEKYILLPSYEEMQKSKRAFAEGFRIEEREQNFVSGATLVQKHGKCFVVNNRPASPLSMKEMDDLYALPFERAWHPSYDKAGGVPAFNEVKFSITSHRGCFGGCSFCSINFHQGRLIQSRSAASILQEAKILTSLPDFKGYIHDVGGPTANFRLQICKKAQTQGPCKDKRCMYPYICKSLPLNSNEYEKLLTDLRKLPKVKKVFVRSGLRFDYAMAEKSRSFLHTLCRYHISGQLKIAPEHISLAVLSCMGKPKAEVYNAFCKEYNDINRKIHKEQYLVPYFISSHPGSTLKDAVMLAEYMRDHHINPEQVQDFIPTPGSRSTCMYYTGLDPDTMRPVYCAVSAEDKAMQRALLQYKDPKNREMVIKALKKAGREDLIGSGKKCLIKIKEGK